MTEIITAITSNPAALGAAAAVLTGIALAFLRTMTAQPAKRIKSKFHTQPAGIWTERK